MDNAQIERLRLLQEEKQKKVGGDNLITPNTLDADKATALAKQLQQKRQSLGIVEEVEPTGSFLVDSLGIAPEDVQLLNASPLDRATRAVSDVISTFATGGVTAPIGVGMGLYEAATPTGSYESGKRVMDEAMKDMQMPTSSEEGEKVLSSIGEFFSFVKDFKDYTGDKAYDLTGNDTISTAVYAFPEIVGSILGVKGMSNKLNHTKETFMSDPLTKQRLLDPNKKQAADLAPVKLDNRTGKVVKDKEAIAVLREGVPPKDVASIKNAAPADKALMREALKIKAKQAAFKTAERTKSTYDVVGRAFSDTLIKLDRQRKKLGTNLEGLVKSKPFKDTMLDVAPLTQNFRNTLSKAGFEVKNVIETKTLANGKIEISKPTAKKEIDFSGSNLVNISDDIKVVMNDAVNLIEKTTGGRKVSAREVHNLKQQLDELIDYRELGNAGSRGNNKSLNYALFELRKGMDDMLDGVFPDTYGKVNTQLRPILESRNYFKKDIENLKSNKRMSTIRELGAEFKNANRKGEEVGRGSKEFIGKVDEINSVLSSQGVPVSYNINSQLNFLDTLANIEKFGDVKGLRAGLYSMGEGLRITGNLSPAMAVKVPAYIGGATLRGVSRFANPNAAATVTRRTQALDKLLATGSISPWRID